MHRCVQKSVQFCRVVLSCVQQWSKRDQAGNEQGEIKFWIDSAIRCHSQAIISFHQLSWANSHHLSWVSCHDLKKAGKVDQTGRNSGLTTDGQTDRLGPVLSISLGTHICKTSDLKPYLVLHRCRTFTGPAVRRHQTFVVSRTIKAKPCTEKAITSFFLVFYSQLHLKLQ